MINISKLYCSKAGQSDELRYSASDLSGPVVVFNCTKRCNLKCMHCYSGSSDVRTGGELTTEEAKKLLAGLAAVKAPVVLFSGGEPLLREDLFKLQFQHRVRRLENTSRLRAIRREIAKVQTVQNTMKKNG